MLTNVTSPCKVPIDKKFSNVLEDCQKRHFKTDFTATLQLSERGTLSGEPPRVVTLFLLVHQ